MEQNKDYKYKNLNLDNILGQEFKILDKGFIRVIDYMGGDDSIVQSARVSYGKGTKSSLDDESLIRYLMRHKHTTPFEMCEIKFHIKAPIFVARQWLRHRTANVNELSARYSIMDDDYYIPQISEIKKQSKSNKQGRGESFSMEESQKIIDILENTSRHCFNVYDDLIENKDFAKELARGILPVNLYTQFYWKIDLHNLFHFLKLRVDSHAQYEIAEYGRKMLDILKIWTPVACKAFLDYSVNSYTFCEEELNLIRQAIDVDKLKNLNTSLSKRELENFKQILHINDTLKYTNDTLK